MLAVIRVRGKTRLNVNLKKTLELMGLSTANQMVFLPEKQLPMIKKVVGYVTWGEIEPSILENVLAKRGRVAGNKKIDAEFLKKHGFKSIKELAQSVMEEKVKLKKLGAKPVFRLKPPRKGFGRKGIKKPYSQGGALGYRASDINDLIKRMS
ncbi:MAG: 50S ribosomal protein L30 [Candidatus Diapherotrites archaeon]|nr:50S ribosomal protein L30 [Candidatus Diapherotrites archaeon]